MGDYLPATIAWWGRGVLRWVGRGMSGCQTPDYRLDGPKGQRGRLRRSVYGIWTAQFGGVSRNGQSPEEAMLAVDRDLEVKNG